MRSDDRVVLTCFAIVLGGGLLVTCLITVGSVGLIGWAGTIVQQTAQVLQIEAAETQQAFQIETENAEALLREVEDWQVVIRDGFDENENDWTEGPVGFDLVAGDLRISEGKYYWDLEAKEGFVYYSYPDMESLSDFYVEVETEQASGPLNGEHGLLFRHASNSYYYYFAITDGRRYSVSLLRAGNWETIIPITFSEEIRSGQTNKLAVLILQHKFYFFINDTLVNFVDSSVLIRGEVGMLAGLSSEGDIAEFVFDNFEVRVPPDEDQ